MLTSEIYKDLIELRNEMEEFRLYVNNADNKELEIDLRFALCHLFQELENTMEVLDMHLENYEEEFDIQDLTDPESSDRQCELFHVGDDIDFDNPDSPEESGGEEEPKSVDDPTLLCELFHNTGDDIFAQTGEESHAK